MSFKYDSSNIKDEFPLLPEDWYAFKIIEAEELQSKNGNPMVLAKCQVINNVEYDEVVWHYVTFLPEDNRGAFISVLFRKAIGVPASGDDIVDADDWVGKRFMGFVIGEKGQDGVTRNKIQKVSPIKDAEPVAASATPTKKKALKEDEIPF